MPYLPFFLYPFILSLVLTPLVRYFAFKKGFISHPRPDRWHKRPTALLGGVSIYFAFILSALVLGLASKNIFGLFVSSLLLFCFGLADDKFHFAPFIKLFVQIIAGSITVLSGVILNLPINYVLQMLLTLFWIIAITNAFNLLDNIDGLAAGIAAISALVLFISAQLFSNNPLSVFALILFGACLGFLPYNFNPAKIFMGDSGSMFLGYCLAVISISGAAKSTSNFLITMFMPVLILSVPIFDTLFVMITRFIQGRSIFQGGRDHTSHHLVALGLSTRRTVLLLYIISIIFGVISILYSRANWILISIIAFFGIVVLMILGAFLYEGISHSKKGIRINNGQDKTVLNNMLLHKRRIVEVFMDFIFIFSAYYFAYYLRFEDTLLVSNLSIMYKSIIWIILIKMSVFFMAGLYRGMWRYVSISDFFTMFKAVSFASLAAILFLTFFYRFHGYSRAVFFIDWLLLLFLIMGSRFLFRILGEFFSIVPGQGKPILIFGAGDTGEMVAREIKKNRKAGYDPVGFIDDDLSKRGAVIQGIPILGPREKIKKIISLKNIKEMIIAIPNLEEEVLSEVECTCRDCGVPCSKVKSLLDNLDKE